MATTTIDFFEHEAVAGLLIAPAYLSKDEHTVLLETIKELPWPATHHGSADGEAAANPQTRKALHYGYTFDYKTMGVDREIPFKDYPPWLRATFPKGERDLSLNRCENDSDCKLGADCRDPDQVTIQYYPPTSGIPPHCDTHSTYTHLYGLSLGSTVTMDFRQPRQEGRFSTSVDLEPGSMMRMTGAARYHYDHGIKKRYSDPWPTAMPDDAPPRRVRQDRWSITYRWLRGDQRDCLCGDIHFCDSEQRRQGQPKEFRWKAEAVAISQKP